MLDILIILACIATGMITGYAFRRNLIIMRAADKASLYAVYALLFILGAGLGSDAELLTRLPELGGKALVISLCCTAMSVAFILPVRLFFTEQNRGKTAASGGLFGPLLGSARILAVFSLGVFLGSFGFMPAWLSDSGVATYALFFLVYSVGIGLGADIRAFAVIREMHIKILAVPVLIIAGSGLGAVAASLLLPECGVKDALCVGMGLGYYSLSSILIEGAGDSALASVALLANIFREITAILAAPLLVRLAGRLTPVAAAGATAMDTGLPVIARFAGERMAIIAVFSGMCLTLLVPILVTAALRL